MSVLSKGALFPSEIAREMFSKVKGHSSLAKMAAAEPVPFNGKDIFVFSLDGEVSIVAENGAKPAGGATIAPKKVAPIKVVYQSRVSDEFVRGAEEVQLRYLREFADGFSKKLASGLDLMAIHGINPATGQTSTVIGDNYFDELIDESHIVEYLHDNTDADENLEEAISLVDDPNGIIIGGTMRAAIATMSTDLGKKYPDFAWGATPENLGNMRLDKNTTVEANSSDDRALVGDFNAFRWGFTEEIPLEVIEYGDPDGTGKDLKLYNQVLLRSEAYIGWAILDEDAFSMVVAP